MDGPPGFLKRLLWQGMARTRVVALAIAAVAFDPAPGACAADDFSPLAEKEIRTAVAGKDITDGSHWSIYLRPDGALISSESGSRWTGIWNIQKASCVCRTRTAKRSIATTSGCQAQLSACDSKKTMTRLSVSSRSTRLTEMLSTAEKGTTGQ
jgi:hypothetical protein